MDKNRRVVLVTGTNSGIGLAVASTFASAGWRTYASMRSESKKENLVKACTEKTSLGNLEVVQMETTNEESVNTVVDSILKKEGHIDLVVNNAGMGYFGPIEAMSDTDIYAQFNVNLFGYVRVIRAVLPSMRERKFGRIINIGSTLGCTSFPFNAAYAASKFALEGLSQGLLEEVEPFGIKVIVIQPGLTKTNYSQSMKHASINIPGDPYRQMKEDAEKLLLGALENWSVPASVVAEVVLKAANAEHPQFRYQCTDHDAKQVASVLVDPVGLNKPKAK